MTENPVNAALAVLLIGEVCFALAAYWSKRVLAWIAIRCMTRIDVMNAASTARRDGLRHWGKKLDGPQVEREEFRLEDLER